ncbi:MAG: SUMF1/EgtB/PvdO family nonheme iron enzyme [Sandaracinaceae bacterium]
MSDAPNPHLDGYLDKLRDELEQCAQRERPRDRLIHARLAVEAILRHLLERPRGNELLSTLIQEAMRERLLDKHILPAFTTVQLRGNDGHHIKDPDENDLDAPWRECQPALENLVRWFFLRRQEPLPKSVRNSLRRLQPQNELRETLLVCVCLGVPLLLIVVSLVVVLSGGPESNASADAVAEELVDAGHTEGDAMFGAVASPARDWPVLREVVLGDDHIWAMRNEVTVEEYERCVLRGECVPPPSALPEGSDLAAECTWRRRREEPRLPVNCMTGEEATAFCAFAAEAAQSVVGRLPTRREWRELARWREVRTRYWSAGADPAALCLPNLCDQSFLRAHPGDTRCTPRSATARCDDGQAGPAAVGTTEPENAWGIQDAVGNLTELVRDESGYARMGRGFRLALTARSAALLPDGHPDARRAQSGFRCVFERESP